MRGFVVEEFGPLASHRLVDLPTPEIAADEVLIDVHAIGLNFPDTLMPQGKYQVRPDRPFTPGRDASGVVVAVGDAVTRCKVGDRVSAQVAWGAFAEQLAAPEARVFVLPDEVDFKSAAAMLTAHNTAYVAVHLRGEVKAGDTIFVTGASGGVGLAIVEMAKAQGARVIAGATSKAKADLALERGADEWVDLSMDDLHNGLKAKVAELTDGKFCDVVFDVVGGSVFDAAMRCVAYRGRMVIVGFASLNISMPKGHHILLKNIAVTGAPLDIHFKNEPETMYRGVDMIFDLFKQDKVRPHIMDVFPLEDLMGALERISNGGITGKIVIDTGRG